MDSLLDRNTRQGDFLTKGNESKENDSDTILKQLHNNSQKKADNKKRTEKVEITVEFSFM